MEIKSQTLFEKLQVKSMLEDGDDLPPGPRYSSWIRALLFVFAVTLCGLLFPQGVSDVTPAVVGNTWNDGDLISEFAFSVPKPHQVYEADLRAATDSVPSVFVIDTAAMKLAEQRVRAVAASLVQQSDTGLVAAKAKVPAELRSALAGLAPEQRSVAVRSAEAAVQALLRKIYERGFISLPKSRVGQRYIAVAYMPTLYRYVPADNVVDSSQFRFAADKELAQTLDPLRQQVAAAMISVASVPNLVYDKDQTELDIFAASESVPKTLGVVRAGETIIRKGEVIDTAIFNRLHAYGKARSTETKDGNSTTLKIIGNIGHALVVLLLFYLYLFFIRRKIYVDNYQLAGIISFIVIASAMSWGTMTVITPFPSEYLIFVPACSMLVAILYDSRTAFYCTVTMVLLMAGIRAHDYESALATLVGSTFAAYTVRDLKSRTQIFRSIGFIFLGYTLAIFATGLDLSTNWTMITERTTVAAVNAIASPLLTFGLLFVVERVLGLTTDLRLLEYDNLNHPLLVQLGDKAPGTYQHTLTVARLAEAAARAIDANPILIRVGAYFHDIGKMSKSEYFVENQMNIANKHDRLAPLKSATIIRNHVEDGIELAREYDLPQRIIDFIPMHHGTMLIRYFYVKALEKGAETGQEVSEAAFRYPGPKPNSKEAAVLMIADSVEAVSRTVDTNNRAELEKAIQGIINERLLDGQFDETDLTMADLAKIKESFVRNLIGFAHTRVKYKEIPRD